MWYKSINIAAVICTLFSCTQTDDCSVYIMLPRFKAKVLDRNVKTVEMTFVSFTKDATVSPLLVFIMAKPDAF